MINARLDPYARASLAIEWLRTRNSQAPAPCRERAALGWVEAVMRSDYRLANDDAFARVTRWFTDGEIVQITMISAAMEAWNRVELSFSRELTDTSDIGPD